MRKAIDFMKTHPLITGIIGVMAGVLTTKAFEPDTIYLIALLRIILTMAMCMFIYLISKEKAFENCHKTTGFILKWGLLTMIVPAVGFLQVIASIVTGQIEYAQGWPGRFVGAIVLSIFVGLFEELIFRVTINDALLYAFRNNKHIFVWIAVVSSLVFGLVHVLSPAAISSPMAFALASLKTLSTAVDGLFLLILYWKTRNIWGIALIHALWDSITFIQSALTDPNVHFGGAENYVGAGVIGLVTYLIQLSVALIAILILWKKVGKTIDFEEIRKTW